MAMELEVAISAVENGGEKPPCSTIAVISITPRANSCRAEPEMALKKQATITHTMAIPPFCVLHRYQTNLISRLEIPLCHDVS